MASLFDHRSLSDVPCRVFARIRAISFRIGTFHLWFVEPFLKQSRSSEPLTNTLTFRSTELGIAREIAGCA